MADPNHDPAAAERLIGRVLALTGLSARDDAERLARAVFSALREQLVPGDRTVLERALPQNMLAREPSLPAHPTEDLQTFYQRVASREGVALGAAVEHSQSACRALSELLSPEARIALQNRLPEALSQLLVVPAASHPPLHAHPAGPSVPANTLANGAPGSRHPISESAPPTGHRHSVARASNPHDDSKLSSSHGATQEREDETLAGAHPRRRDS